MVGIAPRLRGNVPKQSGNWEEESLKARFERSFIPC